MRRQGDLGRRRAESRPYYLALPGLPVVARSVSVSVAELALSDRPRWLHFQLLPDVWLCQVLDFAIRVCYLETCWWVERLFRVKTCFLTLMVLLMSKRRDRLLASYGRSQNRTPSCTPPRRRTAEELTAERNEELKQQATAKELAALWLERGGDHWNFKEIDLAQLAHEATIFVRLEHRSSMYLRVRNLLRCPRSAW